MSDDLERAVAGHYGKPDIVGRIWAALKAAGIDPDHVRPEDLAPVDEFHIGGRAASEAVLARMALGKDRHVLDIGCGIGGTARYMAQAFGSRVSGIDLTPEFVDAARVLSARTGLAHLVDFEVASALALPFEAATFDAAISFHVAMNIKERPTLYAEAARVLKPKARFCVYDVMRGRTGAVRYPAPWAETADTSHLTGPDEMEELLEQAGFSLEVTEDRTAAGIAFFRQRLAPSPDGPPPLGTHILLGPTAKERFENVMKGMEEGAIVPVMMIARKRR